MDVALTALEQRALVLNRSLTDSEARREALRGQLERFVAEQDVAREADREVLAQLLGPRFKKLSERARSTH